MPSVIELLTFYPFPFQIQVTVKNGNKESEKLKELMQSLAKPVVRQQLAKYISSLREEFSKGMILPKKDEIVKTDSTINNLSSGFNKKINMTPVISNNKQIGVKVETSTINSTQKFQCNAQEFYDSMTRIEMVTAFTRGHVKLEPFKGGKFELFGGNISGTFEELVPGKKIVQRWRYKQWPAEHYSTVTMEIVEKVMVDNFSKGFENDFAVFQNDHTEVNLKQTGVPVSELEVTKDNWERYYWDSIKKTFGFGAFII